MKPDQPGIEGGAQRRARRPRTTQPRRARCSRAQRSRFSEPPVSDASLRASLAGQERSLRPERGPRLSPENHKCLQIAAKPRFKESRRFKSPSLHQTVVQASLQSVWSICTRRAENMGPGASRCMRWSGMPCCSAYRPSLLVREGGRSRGAGLHIHQCSLAMGRVRNERIKLMHQRQVSGLAPPLLAFGLNVRSGFGT